MKTFLIVYLISLVYTSFQKGKIIRPSSLRSAWTWFAWTGIVEVIFTFIRAGAYGRYRGPRDNDLALIEVWASGISWLFLVISIFALRNALTEATTIDTPPPLPTQKNETGA
ncbi:MAG TPA: hypothetical protein PLE80_06260 [Opitutaceae bacterium]|jgi:vacuolar-type H+-ATPase subunit I/STV1|nr:hypothetical protein [Opitutaceae bacterium]